MEWKDGKIRCRWANPGNERYIHYHDHEWGVPVHDDRKLFEMLVRQFLVQKTAEHQQSASFTVAFCDFGLHHHVAGLALGAGKDA